MCARRVGDEAALGDAKKSGANLLRWGDFLGGILTLRPFPPKFATKKISEEILFGLPKVTQTDEGNFFCELGTVLTGKFKFSRWNSVKSPKLIKRKHQYVLERARKGKIHFRKRLGTVIPFLKQILPFSSAVKHWEQLKSQN